MESKTENALELEADETNSNENTIFEQDGVFIHLNLADGSPDVILGGTLQVIEKENQQFLKWKSNEKEAKHIPDENHSDDNKSCDLVMDEVVNTSVSSQKISSMMRQPPLVIKQQVLDQEWSVVSQNNSNVNVDQSEENYVAIAEETFCPSYDFIVPFEHLRSIKKSDKKFSWKYIVFELHDNAFLPPLHFHQKGCKKFLKALKVFLTLTPSPKNPQLLEITSRHQVALTQSLNELDLYSETASENTANFFASAMSGFSKVTNFIHDVLNPQEVIPQTRPASERATLIDEETNIFDKDGEEGEYEHISCPKLTDRVDPPRQSPMNEEFWIQHKDQEGRILNVDEVISAIFHGGIVPGLRKEVWKYLLGYYDWNMTEEEIDEHRQKRQDDYYRVKMQWKSVDEDQESRFSSLRDQKSLIEKDVNRTDRKRLFYEGEKNISLSLLNDVLVTYVMFNFDLGYVQGMSDLLSPILETMGSEVDAFWCFVGFMKLVEHNFDKSQRGMKLQLQNLRTLLEFFDPELMDDLKEKDSHNLYFCFRWLLLLFKREFSFEDIQTLWEVIWTGLPCSNYHLLVCVALLDTERQTLLLKECGLNDILKHINELSNSIDLNKALAKSEGLYNQLLSCKEEIPAPVRDVLKLSKS